LTDAIDQLFVEIFVVSPQAAAASHAPHQHLQQQVCKTLICYLNTYTLIL